MTDSIRRRDFLKTAGAQAGLLAVGAKTLGAAEPVVEPVAEMPGRFLSAPAVNGKTYDIAVVGAGAFGGWTAYWARKLGASVVLIDAYGPGNSRSTSGDETRGVRSTYGNLAPPQGEQWMMWANRSIQRWKAWDDEWGRDLKMRLFVTTGDFTFRSDWDSLTTNSRDLFVKNGVKHEVVDVKIVKKEFPQFDLRDITVCLYEAEAGVVRARRATQCVAEVFQKMGGDIVIARAYPGPLEGGKIGSLVLNNHDTVKAQTYIFALGPWMGKTFPGLMGPRMRQPIGRVCYFATPHGDNRFEYPNMPSFNFPGVTGWPTLPFDSRGLRVRGGGGGGGGGRGGGGGGGGNQGPLAQLPPTPVVGGPDQDPDLSDRYVDPLTVERARAFLAERIPLMKDQPLNETRACHYEQSSSRNFVIDRHPDIANAWIAGGGNAEAFKQGPTIGEYIARRALNKDLEPQLAAGFRIPTDTYEGIIAPAPASRAAYQGSSGNGEAGFDD